MCKCIVLLYFYLQYFTVYEALSRYLIWTSQSEPEVDNRWFYHRFTDEKTAYRQVGKWVAQGHTANKQSSWDLHLSCLPSRLTWKNDEADEGADWYCTVLFQRTVSTFLGFFGASGCPVRPPQQCCIYNQCRGGEVASLCRSAPFTHRAPSSICTIPFTPLGLLFRCLISVRVMSENRMDLFFRIFHLSSFKEKDFFIGTDLERGREMIMGQMGD